MIFTLDIFLPSVKALFDFLARQEELQVEKPEIRWIFPQLYLRFPGHESFDRHILAMDRFDNSHNRPGVLSVTLSGPISNFIITFKPLPELDASATVIGHAIEGLKTLELMRCFGHKSSGQTLEPVNICEWGIIKNLKQPQALHKSRRRGS